MAHSTRLAAVLGFLDRGLRGLRDALDRAYRAVDEASPVGLLLRYLFFAAALFIATAATGLLSIRPQVAGADRLKGFGWELNWAPNHLVAVPVALFCCGLVLREIARVVRDLCMSGMVIDRDFAPIPPDLLLEDWERRRIGPFWFGVIALLAFGMSWGEWFYGSFGPIVKRSLVESTKVMGWTTGAALDPSINRWLNAALSFVAFSAQGFIITVLIYTVGTLLAFSEWLFGHDVVPDLSSRDDRKRMGFERFEPLILRFFLMALAFVVSFFLIRIQSLYDASDSAAGTAYEFALDDVVKGFFAEFEGIFRGRMPELFVIGNARNYSTIVVSAACSVLLMVALILPNLILSLLAYQGRELMLRCVRGASCPPCDSRGLSRDACEARLSEMDFWPLRYPRPVELLAYVVFAGFCFFFYKFTLLLLGALIIRMIAVPYRTLVKQTGSDKARAPGSDETPSSVGHAPPGGAPAEPGSTSGAPTGPAGASPPREGA